jgi:large subunit ribosomal protein L24
MPKTEAVIERKKIEIRRNDTVKVIAGKDKGKQGRVLRVFPGDNKLLVEHVMMVRKHVKANPPRVKGGIAEQESRIALSNVMVVCSSCNRPVRIGHDTKGDQSVRVCRRCGMDLDTNRKK